MNFTKLRISNLCYILFIINGGSRRAEKNRKVLMMMMMLPNWGGQVRSRAGAGPKQSKSGAEAWAGQEQGRNRAGEELSRVKQSRAERGQELGRNWGGASNVMCLSVGPSVGLHVILLLFGLKKQNISCKRPCPHLLGFFSARGQRFSCAHVFRFYRGILS